MTEDALVYQPARFRRVYVDDTERLREVADQLAGRDALGVDVEMGQRVHRRPGGLQEWRHILALIQIASDDLSVVIDPLRCRNLTPLRPLLAGSARKVFLGGGQDVTLLERAGLPVRTVADVGEVALGVFGRREDGMAALAHRIFGITLDKTVRRTDWLARPLNAGLITYAHRDAELTLLIYRWFRLHYPQALALHEREHLEPPLGADAPEWLREAVRRSSVEVPSLVMEHGLDPGKDTEALAEAIRGALRSATAPRRVNRLLRVATDLNLRELADEAASRIDSPSSLIRAAAARALGQLADPELGEQLLQRLSEDPIEEVRKTAEGALKELRRPRPAPQAPPEPDEPASSLDDATRSSLEQLLQRMQEAD